MTHDHGPIMTHEDTYSNLPWFITGRMSQQDSAAAALHIALCVTCQQELEAQTQLRDAMLTPENLEFAPQASFQKLRARIAEMERELPGDPVINDGATAAAQPPATPPRWLRPLMIGQLAAAAVIASLLLWTVADRWLTPRYQTATLAEPSAARGLQLRVIVSPQMSVADFTARLQAQHVRIIGGPNAENAWTLLLPEPADAAAGQALLAQWRSDARVLFAEPVAGAAAP